MKQEFDKEVKYIKTLSNSDNYKEFVSKTNKEVDLLKENVGNFNLSVELGQLRTNLGDLRTQIAVLEEKIEKNEKSPDVAAVKRDPNENLDLDLFPEDYGEIFMTADSHEATTKKINPETPTTEAPSIVTKATPEKLQGDVKETETKSNNNKYLWFAVIPVIAIGVIVAIFLKKRYADGATLHEVNNDFLNYNRHRDMNVET